MVIPRAGVTDSGIEQKQLGLQDSLLLSSPLHACLGTLSSTFCRKVEAHVTNPW